MESPAASSSASTNPTTDQTTPIRPDPLVFTVGDEFTRWKPNVIGSVRSVEKVAGYCKRRRNLQKICRNLQKLTRFASKIAEISLDLLESRRISPNMVEISQDLLEFELDLARVGWICI